MRDAKNNIETGFSARAKTYFKKGSLFSKDKTFDGELKSLRRVVRKNAEDSESRKHYSYHTFVIKKGSREMTYVFKGHPGIAVLLPAYLIWNNFFQNIVEISLKILISILSIIVHKFFKENRTGSVG